MTSSATLATAILLLPAGAAALVGLLGPRLLRGRSHWVVILAVGAALALSWRLFEQVRAVPAEARAEEYARTHTVYSWFRADVGERGHWFDIDFRIDPLTCVMLLTVLSVSLLVVIYSVGYLRDHHGRREHGYERFFAFLALFVFSMCTLVLAGNFILLYVGWELVGLCSYLLIGFYYPRPSAAAAAQKAFLVNRVGDLGFGLGILVIYLSCGDLRYEAVFSEAGLARLDGRETLVSLLLLCGAVGKSAQLPLHVWLPDAMEGPTPVSALIHAATMVTAGVYMVARCGAIFAESATAMAVVATIGAATALFAATIALAQTDLKRVLAYSTISQLGYMFLGLGAMASDSAIFHLFTHAFFKALLFLGAGSVMHALHGEIDLRRFGGLGRSMPVTAATFWIGGLALAGFPLLSGFWSKDEIIHAALMRSPWLGVTAQVTAFLTAFYTFRMIFLAFHGPRRLPEGVEHAHESGRWMIVPLLLLSLGAVGAGAAGVIPGDLNLHEQLRTVLVAMNHAPRDELLESFPLMALSGGLAVLGIGGAWFVYRRRPILAMAAAVLWPRAARVLRGKYFIDEFYDALIVRPLRRLGRVCYGTDRFGIDTVLWLITAVPRSLGFMLKESLQQGALQGYAMGMVVGLLVIVVAVLAGG